MKGVVPVSLASRTSTEVGFILEDIFSLFHTVLEKLLTSVIRTNNHSKAIMERREFLCC